MFLQFTDILIKFLFNCCPGLELRTSELEPILASLSKPHAEAIKQRVRTLNQTVRGRSKNRQKRKPDIRDVFRDFDESSTGTRSRSATPDSLDSIQGDEVWGNASIDDEKLKIILIK
uniref:Uncharacterized protein n=1 Tax=Glossina brevipalpis TaxID=37001 RepID=A0A1A9X4G2_9MUSC